ncbi:hypothetical protein AALC25_17815, partial [Lachnospiraceae bacterium 29-84]
ARFCMDWTDASVPERVSQLPTYGYLRKGEQGMSVQDKIERILKEIHLLFSSSEWYDETDDLILVQKQKVFQLLEQLNLAVYEAMDQYEATRQQQEIAQRRCEKRGDEIILKASRHADDIYAASIMYTDDAINRICHIMDDVRDGIVETMNQARMDMEEQKVRVRKNQLELTGQLRDFADTDKYIKLIEEENRKLEEGRRLAMEGRTERRIPNEGRAYVSDSLERVTGKDFAESLRRRAAKMKEQELEIEDMSDVEDTALEEAYAPVLGRTGVSSGSLGEIAAGEEESALPDTPPEIRVNLDAEYFRWKEAGSGLDSQEALAEGEKRERPQEKKERHFPFGRK